MWRYRMFFIGTVLVVGVVLVGSAEQSPKKIYKHFWQERLLPQRLDTVRKVYEQKLEHFQSNHGSPSELFVWSEHWLDAELAIAANHSERLDAFKTYRERALRVEGALRELVLTGRAQQADADAANYYSIEAAIRWETEKMAP